MFLTYRQTTVEVPLTHSRDDQLVIVHTLARLVRRDSDIRFCLDSHHSSDLAFLALPPGDWKALEKEFGTDTVAYRFLSLPEKLKEFEKKAFSKKNKRQYKPLEYGPSAAHRRPGKAGTTAIALKDNSGTLAGFFVLSGPIVDTFDTPDFQKGHLVVPPSTPLSPARKFLSQRKDREVDVAVEVRRETAQIAGAFRALEAFVIKLGKGGAGTWAFHRSGEVLPSGRCHLVDDEEPTGAA